jgi:hypothetical protein
VNSVPLLTEAWFSILTSLYGQVNERYVLDIIEKTFKMIGAYSSECRRPFSVLLYK